MTPTDTPTMSVDQALKHIETGLRILAACAIDPVSARADLPKRLAAIATLRAAIEAKDASILELRQVILGADRAIRYEAELAEEDGHTMRVNAYEHARAIIQIELERALRTSEIRPS